MSQPTVRDVHQVDSLLSDLSTAYIQDDASFIASKVFPVVNVDHQTNKYYTYTKGDWFRDEVQLRGPATESAGSGYTLSTDNYACDVYALHKDIPDQVRKNVDGGINLDNDAVRFLSQRMLLRQEIQFVSDFFGTSIWGTDNSTATKWSTYTTSDPLGDVETAKRTILVNTGMVANTLVIGYDVFIQLKNHPDIIDRIKYTSSNIVTTDLLARMFDIDRILVAKAIKNTANEGATTSFSFTHGKHALLMYVAPNPGLLTPSAGYTFAWRGFNDLGMPITVSRYRMDLKKADRIEVEAAWDNKVVGTDLGYFFSNIVA